MTYKIHDTRIKSIISKESNQTIVLVRKGYVWHFVSTIRLLYQLEKDMFGILCLQFLGLDMFNSLCDKCVDQQFILCKPQIACSTHKKMYNSLIHVDKYSCLFRRKLKLFCFMNLRTMKPQPHKCTPTLQYVMIG